ncbi:MAG TPA: Clp protease N-terminal domain-containing protein [Iamia sp.]
MTPAPALPDLVTTVEADAPSSEPLAQLSTATTTAADLTRAGDDLIGHFVDRCRQAGHSWAEISDALGVSRQAAHKRFRATEPPLERFTLRAQQAFQAATAEAEALGHPFIGTEHILLGLFTPPGSVAAHLLAGAGLTHDGVVEKVVAKVPRGNADTATVTAYTPRAVSVLGGMLSSALGLGHNYIGTEHMLLGLHREPEGLGAQILVEAGLDADAARTRIITVLSGFTGT